MSTQVNTKHLRYKVVDNVAVLTLDSPGVKVCNKYTHLTYNCIICH